VARPRILTDEEILARARAVFADKGLAAPTTQIAAAVGLTWGAIAFRFGRKRWLFARAMSAAPDSPADAAAAIDAPAPLACVLRRLRARLAEQWPLRLQCRLAAAGTDHDDGADASLDELRTALASSAAQAGIRCDIDVETLARLVLALLVGEASQRFVARTPASGDDAAFIAGVLQLLAAR
jgi:AcrR family transcriptional regulator